MMSTPPITVGGHRHVGGTEVHGAVVDLVDPRARADRLIVQLDAGGGGGRLAPLGVNRRGEGGACTGDLSIGLCDTKTGQANR
jgi:hypothetical protein